ncbi:hypothetical protein I7I51_07850 [Histoplasma capsulatum]|uniref:Uncharacterized protein n=1 Tax=Ajellomyces capsulatus TaxID=5037 RepID=A0A8A1M181_AJECA|nr:hypothetical protein I7I51_07850 [Histoplasma capsulatum]
MNYDRLRSPVQPFATLSHCSQQKTSTAVSADDDGDDDDGDDDDDCSTDYMYIPTQEQKSKRRYCSPVSSSDPHILRVSYLLHHASGEVDVMRRTQSQKPRRRLLEKHKLSSEK